MRKFLIVDNNIIYRSSLSEIIYSLGSTNVVFEIDTLDKAIEVTEKYQKVDVLIINLFDFEDKEIEKIETLKANNNELKVLAITSNIDNRKIDALSRYGSLGIVGNASNHSSLKSAISSILNNEDYICDSLLRKKVEDMTKEPDDSHESTVADASLTTRQRQVLDYIVKGYANKLIAYELGVSEGTIKLHVSSILRALKVTNRTEAAMRAGRFFQSAAH